MLLSPPVTYFLSSKIRKCRISGPYGIDIDISIYIFCKIIMLDSLSINVIVLVFFHTGINNGNCLESLFFQVSNQLIGVCEVVLIPGEYSIAIHIINIKINSITWNLISSEICCQLSYLCLCLITPAALMIAKCPAHRQRYTSCQPRITANNFRHIFTCNDIIIHHTVFCPVFYTVFIFFTQIKGTLAMIIKEYAIYRILF